LALLAVEIFLRLQHISVVSYWFVEGFCLKLVEFPLLEMLQRAAEDPHPPLFYLLLKLWISVLGASPIATRQLSLLPGIAAVAGVFLVMNRAGRATVAPDM